MSFDDFVAAIKSRGYNSIVEGDRRVVDINLALAQGFIDTHPETQIVALALYLGAVWAASLGETVKADDGSLFMMDFDKRMVLFEAVAGASFRQAMEGLPAILQKVGGNVKGH